MDEIDNLIFISAMFQSEESNANLIFIFNLFPTSYLPFHRISHSRKRASRTEPMMVGVDGFARMKMSRRELWFPKLKPYLKFVNVPVSDLLVIVTMISFC